jgi:cytochrome bd-type quinol oxidase subunit 2
MKIIEIALAQGWNPDELSKFNLSGASIAGIIINLLLWISAVLGIVAMISFMISGLMYLTAAGDETQAEKAKKAMTYSIIGVIVGLSGFVVLNATKYMLSGSSIF